MMKWLNRLRPPEKTDREMEEFRNIMQPPSSFEEGFSWLSLVGVLFIALLMVPGALYMRLLAGAYQIGPAAQWVTVILFIEVARRAQKHIKRAEVFVLFYMAGAVMLMPFYGLLWNQFYIRSDAAVASGIAEGLPHWFAPATDSSSYIRRSFLHPDWLPAVALVVFGTLFSQLNKLILGYGLFRLTSDVEKLPFPMAPVGAQGVMALAEEREEKVKAGKEAWRWRVFAIGSAIGIFFGLVYLGVPTISGAIASPPLQIFEIPFTDFTEKTQNLLPAVATGISWDLGNVIWGMVFPYFAILGSFIGLIITFAANPILYKLQILHNWHPGADTIKTMFVNNVDFYFSFTIGISIAIALGGIIKMSGYFFKKKGEKGSRMRARPPEGRGDMRPSLIIILYIAVTLAYILVSGFLIKWHRGVMITLFFLGFVYTPLISYVTARLEGIAGQIVEVPLIREAFLILSGYQGVAVWFLPIPVANYGQMTVFYRQCELTGTKFSSIWKAQLILYPIIIISSILFANFIWSLAEAPSPLYPFAQKIWPLEAANRSIMYSATLGEYSMFEEAFRWKYLYAGAGFGLLLFMIMSYFGAPVFLVYGVVKGLGQTLPHAVIPQMIGALIGKFYFQKKLGLKWRQYVPVIGAGFACGMGLITMLCVGIVFLSKSVIKLPF